jgi:hypothetical protein
VEEGRRDKRRNVAGIEEGRVKMTTRLTGE